MSRDTDTASSSSRPHTSRTAAVGPRRPTGGSARRCRGSRRPAAVTNELTFHSTKAEEWYDLPFAPTPVTLRPSGYWIGVLKASPRRRPRARLNRATAQSLIHLPWLETPGCAG
jgi:hypothetical protein